jgi:hypothetical protein
MSESEWVDGFVREINHQRIVVRPELVAAMAHELSISFSDVDPKEIAQANFDTWLPGST